MRLRYLLMAVFVAYAVMRVFTIVRASDLYANILIAISAALTALMAWYIMEKVFKLFFLKGAG